MSDDKVIDMSKEFQKAPRRKRDVMYQQIADDYGYELFPRGGASDTDRNTMTAPACKVSSSTYTLLRSILDKSNGEYMTMSQVLADIITWGAGVLHKHRVDPDDMRAQSAYERYLDEVGIREKFSLLNYITSQIEYLDSGYAQRLFGEEEYIEGKLNLFKLCKHDKYLLAILKEKLGGDRYEGKTWEEWLEEEI